MRTMTFSAKQTNELKGLLDDLGLTYTDQDLTVIAYSIAKFVLVKEVDRNRINVITKDNI